MKFLDRLINFIFSLVMVVVSVVVLLVMFDFADAYFLDKYSPSNINLVASSNQTKTLQMMDEKYVSSPKNESLEGVYLKETIKPTESSLLENPAPKADLVDILVY